MSVAVANEFVQNAERPGGNRGELMIETIGSGGRSVKGKRAAPFVAEAFGPVKPEVCDMTIPAVDWPFALGRGIKLSPGGKVLLVGLALTANGVPYLRMTDQEAADEFRLGIGAVRRAIARMEAAGVIRVERYNRRVTGFHLLKGYPPQDGGMEP